MTPNRSNRVIVIVEGGLADWVLKPDGVEVEIYDFDELSWLSRGDRYELMSQLESGDEGPGDSGFSSDPETCQWEGRSGIFGGRCHTLTVL